jgi:hypothetical protein
VDQALGIRLMPDSLLFQVHGEALAPAESPQGDPGRVPDRRLDR